MTLKWSECLKLPESPCSHLVGPWALLWEPLLSSNNESAGRLAGPAWIRAAWDEELGPRSQLQTSLWPWPASHKPGWVILVLIMTKYVLILWRGLPLCRAEAASVQSDYRGGVLTCFNFLFIWSSARKKVYVDIRERFANRLFLRRASVSTDWRRPGSRSRLVDSLDILHVDWNILVKSQPSAKSKEQNVKTMTSLILVYAFKK